MIKGTRLPALQTFTAVCGVAILVTLGTWQIQRLHWKQNIIAGLEQSYAGAKFTDLSQNLLQDLESGKIHFAYGAARGHWQKEKAILLGPRTNDGRAGYHLLIPMTLKDGKTLIVNTGWVSDMWKDTLGERLAVLPSGSVQARGVAHMPDWSSMASKNSPANDLWFRADVKEIAAAKDLKDVYSHILYADKIEPPLNDVAAHEEKWLPRNKHLQYALFWYAMAATLAGVFGFYIRDLNKKSV